MITFLSLFQVQANQVLRSAATEPHLSILEEEVLLGSTDSAFLRMYPTQLVIFHEQRNGLGYEAMVTLQNVCSTTVFFNVKYSKDQLKIYSFYTRKSKINYFEFYLVFLSFNNISIPRVSE